MEERQKLSKEKAVMKDELCRILSKIKALEFGTFKLASGRVSPYYVDLRIVPSFPDAYQRIGNLYVKLIEVDVGAKNFERIAGIPTAGIPFASVVAFSMKKPFLYIRQHTKLHGRERQVEGILNPGDSVLLVDDLITSGKSLKKAARAIRAEGGVVNDVIVLVDREEGGKENLAKQNIRLHYLLKISEAAKKLFEIGVLEENELKTVLKQAKAR